MDRPRSLGYFDKLVRSQRLPDLVKTIKRLQPSLQQRQLFRRKSTRLGTTSLHSRWDRLRQSLLAFREASSIVVQAPARSGC